MAAASVLEQRKFDGDHKIQVADQSGDIVFTVSFREVIQISDVG